MTFVINSKYMAQPWSIW